MNVDIICEFENGSRCQSILIVTLPGNVVESLSLYPPTKAKLRQPKNAKICHVTMPQGSPDLSLQHNVCLKK